MMLFLTACTGTTKVNNAEPTEQVEPDGQIDLEPPVNGANTFAYDELERKYVSIFHPIYNESTTGHRHAWVHCSGRIIEGYSGMNALADEHGFVVVYPEGTKDDFGNNFFNVGYDFHDEVDVMIMDIFMP